MSRSLVSLKKYDVIVVDPPWKIKKILRKSRPNQVEMDYPMMELEQIKSLPISKIAEDNSTLFLWTTDRYLFDSRDILEKWGFKYHLTMSWDKGNGICLFGFHRVTEFCLVGFRGEKEAYPKRKTIPTSFSAKSERHSAKPDEFYSMLENLGGAKIDVFARKKREGWDCFGNEVESDIDLFGE